MVEVYSTKLKRERERERDNIYYSKEYFNKIKKVLESGYNGVLKR